MQEGPPKRAFRSFCCGIDYATFTSMALGFTFSDLGR
jgi:hypothetical protein